MIADLRGLHRSTDPEKFSADLRWIDEVIADGDATAVRDPVPSQTRGVCAVTEDDAHEGDEFRPLAGFGLSGAARSPAVAPPADACASDIVLTPVISAAGQEERQHLSEESAAADAPLSSQLPQDVQRSTEATTHPSWSELIDVGQKSAPGRATRLWNAVRQHVRMDVVAGIALIAVTLLISTALLAPDGDRSAPAEGTASAVGSSSVEPLDSTPRASEFDDAALDAVHAVTAQSDASAHRELAEHLLEARRAYISGDSSDPVAAPESPALRDDERVRGLMGGAEIVDWPLTVHDAQVVDLEPGRAELRIHATEGDITTRTADGTVATQAGAGEVLWTLTLERSEDRWQIVDVQARPA